MAITEEQLIQRATYWSAGLSRSGGRVVGEAVPIMCRWFDKNEEIIDEKGHTHHSTAKVFIPSGPSPGDLLALGTQDTPDSAIVIKKVASNVSYGGEETVRVAWL